MLVIMSVVIMTVDHRYQHLQVVRSSLATLTYPLQYLAHLPSAISEILSENLNTRNDLISDNEKLREQALFNQAKLQRLALLEQENARLRQLLDSPVQISNEQVLIAEILSVDLHPFKQLISINKGKRQGVYEGQPLVAAKGIIGQVVEVFPMHSSALLISDPNHALLAETNRTNLRALLVGSGKTDRVELKNVSSSADIRIGDLLHTSGLDGRYPPNYPIAEVTTINNRPGEAFLHVEARPLADLDTIREVLLLWTTPPPKEETDSEKDIGEQPLSDKKDNP
ncbi:MAG: rod shape-determining protein MreC [Gammaproteobacteria bacterium]|nr:rod shape-determining protein MreC [Gammaproteobacteria bacterium]